jgi:hypothetical protein
VPVQIEQAVIDSLVSRPAEALNVEIKRWIDPDSSAGIEKIVKGALALRNRNGGYLVIGFDDTTLLPDSGHEPVDIRGVFHVDKIQGHVSRHSSELFEIAIAFGIRNGVEHPVMIVPPGVRVPVAAKRNLIDGQRTLIRLGAVYFRTLAANGTVSTAEARPEDWRDIVEICFDNRETDIGRFLRRQLGGGDIATFVDALRQVGLEFNIPPVPTLRDRALALLDDGESRFQMALQSRSLDADAKRLAIAGSWSVALVIDPPKDNARPDRTFSNTLASANPRFTGWPIWQDSSASSDAHNRPVVRDRAVEALIISIVSGWSDHLDFSRLDPKGEFFLRRTLQDDAVSRVPPGKVLDPILAILRTGEAIAVGLAFAKALGWGSEDTRLSFAFRWTRLSGRQLESWANPLVPITGGTAHDDTATTFVELSLDTPLTAIAPSVEQATLDLFLLFDGYKLPTEAIEYWVRRLIERNLGF